MKKLNILLLLVMVFSFTIGLALGEVKKTEIVYANLDDYGAPLGIYVINNFESDADASVVDYGVYDAVFSLSQVDGINYKNDEISFDMPKGRYQYQGNLVDRELPWDIAISYKLNDSEIKAEELSGAEGKLEISIAITPKIAEFSDKLVLQISVSLPSNKAFNIASEGATIEVAGTNYTLAFVVLPTMDAEFTITADVEDFHMPAMQFAGINMGMSNEMYTEYVKKLVADLPIADMVENMAANMFPKQVAPKSFVDERNGNIASLQFVFLSEGISAKPAPVKEVPNEKADESFMDRLLGLFGN
jgi:hypothetical protein